LDSRGKPVERSAWTKLGGVYHVLSIWIEPEHSGLRLVGEQLPPGLFAPEMFEVVSSVIPSTWGHHFAKPGCLELGPEAWARPGFWEEFYDRKPAAVGCFEHERNRIVAADP
jgi:hypothetical protein